MESKLVLLTDNDFDGYLDGEFTYKGDDRYVIIPEKIKGVTVTITNNFAASK